MATTPDSFRVGDTKASRPSKMMIVALVGIVIAFFAVTLTHNPAEENAQPAVTTTAPSE